MSYLKMNFPNDTDINRSFNTKDHINRLSMSINEFFQNLDYNYQRPLLELSTYSIKENVRSNRRKSSPTRIQHHPLTCAPTDKHLKIYYGQKPIRSEMATSTSLTSEMHQKKQKQPDYWTTGDLVRFLDNSNKSITDTIASIDKNIHWSKSISSNFSLTENAAELLSQGHFYIAGRTKNGHPIMVISFAQLEITEDLHKDAELAFLFVLMTMKKYMMIGKYCESYHLFIDFNGTYSKANHNFFKKIQNIINVNFQHSGIKFWIYNAHWSFITSQKVINIAQRKSNNPEHIYIKPTNLDQLLEYILPRNWEKRFGGVMNEYQPGQFWPPRDFNTAHKKITKEYILENQLHAFWIFGDEKDSRIWKFERDQFQLKINQKLWMDRLTENRYILGNYKAGTKPDIFFKKSKINLDDSRNSGEQTTVPSPVKKNCEKSYYDHCMSVFGWCCVDKVKSDEEITRKKQIDSEVEIKQQIKRDQLQNPKNVRTGLSWFDEKNNYMNDSFQGYSEDNQDEFYSEEKNSYIPINDLIDGISPIQTFKKDQPQTSYADLISYDNQKYEVLKREKAGNHKERRFWNSQKDLWQWN